MRREGEKKRVAVLTASEGAATIELGAHLLVPVV